MPYSGFQRVVSYIHLPPILFRFRSGSGFADIKAIHDNGYNEWHLRQSIKNNAIRATVTSLKNQMHEALARKVDIGSNGRTENRID